MSQDLHPILLPQWGMGMTEGTVIEWYKDVGDRIEVGDPLVLIEASKTEVEMESPVAGTVVELVAVPDEIVPVQGTIALVRLD